MTETQIASFKSVEQWLTQGESLYSVVLSEYRALEAQLAELEGRIRDKGGEVNTIARILSKPTVEPVRSVPPIRQVPDNVSADETLRLMAGSRCGAYSG